MEHAQEQHLRLSFFLIFCLATDILVFGVWGMTCTYFFSGIGEKAHD